MVFQLFHAIPSRERFLAVLTTLLLASLGLLYVIRSPTAKPVHTTVHQEPTPVLLPIIPLGLHSAIPKFPVFMVFQQNTTMLQHAFDSAQDAFPNQIVIIDNSGTLGLSTNPDFKTAAAIWHTVVSLSFPQLHNIMAALSAARGFDMYAWMHADAVVLKVHPEVNPGDTVMSALRPLGQEWSVAFTDYDFLAFFNTEVILKEPWDDFLQNYLADCDAYTRWHMAGHKPMNLVNYEKHFVIVHLADVPSQRWGDMTPAQRQLLYPPLAKVNAPHGLDPNHWKWSNQARRRDMSAQQRRFEAARAYYKDKWNTTTCDLPLTAKPRFEVPPSVMMLARAGVGDARDLPQVHAKP